jgi:PAS domain S-box-containing protein
LPVYIAYIDADCNYQFVNSEYEKFYGLAKEDIIGRPIYEVMGAEATNLVREKIELALSGSRVSFEAKIPGRNDHKDWDADINYVPHLNDKDEVLGFYVLSEDITSRKSVEDDLLKAKNDADAANRAKTEFLSHMSHELRTPLNAILGFGQLLSSDSLEPLSDSQKEYAEHITESGEHLLQLINEILELSKIEAGKIKLEMQNVDLTEVLEECLSMLSSQAEKLGLKITNKISNGDVIMVWSDHNRLRQILINLLSNAIKYNRENGSITISVEDAGIRDGRSYLKVNVIDTGIGIPENLQKKLFIPFERLGSEEHDIVGTGIGLTITQKLVNLVGGELGFESEQDVGSTFWFTLAQIG